MLMTKLARFFSMFFLLCVFVTTPVKAALHLELTQGVDSAIPVAFIPFKNQESNFAGGTLMTTVISNDLQNSGEFRIKTPGSIDGFSEKSNASDVNYWRKQGVNAVISGQIKKSLTGNYKVSFQLLSVYAQSEGQAASQSSDAILLKEKFTVKKSGLRQLAHHISDLIYQKLTGVKGIFATKIAYVLVQAKQGEPRQYLLMVADADGYNPQVLLRSNQPIMSPTWMPNGQAIAYVSFEGHESSIYLQKLATGKRELISRFPGINGAPAFSPDGKKLALVLSKTGNPKIYTLDLSTNQLKQITHGYAIDTEPVWAKDGSALFFTSNRAGGPQIFQYEFSNGSISRVTFDGNYNARACLTPAGKQMVMMHRESGLFGIAKLDLSSGRTTLLTASGSDESPSLAPNGKMVLYGTQFAGREVLGVVSIDGRVKLRLPAQEGDVQDPAWSPYLQ